MIASGQSIDSKWEEFKEDFNSKNYIIWLFVVSIVVLLPLISFFTLRLFKRVKKDEDKIRTLSAIPKADNRLVQYVDTARREGLPDEAVVQRLKENGWSDTDINIAMNYRGK